MFGNKHPINVHVNSPAPVNNYTTVEVHNPPTADITKFLKELETEAQKKIDQTIRVEDNSFNAVIHLSRDMLNDSTVARVVFDLNGFNIVVTASVERKDRDDTQKLLSKLRDAVAHKIATEILVKALSDVRLTI